MASIESTEVAKGKRRTAIGREPLRRTQPAPPITLESRKSLDRYRETKRERFLSDAEIADLGKALSAMEDERQILDAVAGSIRLLLMTGLRLGEALALRWEDVDLEAAACCRRPGGGNGSRK